MPGTAARLAAFALAVAVTVAAAPAAAAGRGPSTPEERQKLVALSAQLEAAPRGPEADEARRWLMTFLQEVPDILAKQCGSLFGTGAQRQAMPPEVLQQQIFSNAAYAVGEQVSPGSTEALAAGLRGALRAYEAIKAADAAATHPSLEELLRMEGRGELVTYVRSQGRACR